MRVHVGPGAWRHPRRLVSVLAVVPVLLLTACTGIGSSTAVVGPPASILGWAPGVARDVPLTAPLTVYFTRAVNRSSIERSWRLLPHVPGVFHWGETSVSFTPSQAMQAGASYRLTVGRHARDDRGQPLTNALDVAFSTGDPLKVLSVTPAASTAQVPLNGLVAITFNHPMVALAGLDATVPDPAGWSLTLTPRTAGHGSWLGTSTWVFRPDTGLVPSSRYTVTLRGSAQDAWGETLGHDLTWPFATVTPQIVATTPADHERYADPNGPLRITFNQPMDHPSTEQAVSLQSGRPVPGTVSWDGNTLIYTPSVPLDPARQYSVVVAPSARAADASATLGAAFRLSFTVAQPPRVLSTTPAQGATSSAYDVELHFSAPMRQRTVDRSLAVSPPLPDMFTSTYGATYSISGSFKPSTAYTVSIGKGAEDRFGRLLAAPYTLHFTTAPLAPMVAFSGMPGIYGGIAFSAGRSMDAPLQETNVSRVHYTLLRVSPATAVQSPGGCGGQAPAGTTVRDWSADTPSPLDRPQALRLRLAQPGGAPLPPGIYWLGARGTPAPSAQGLFGSLQSSELVLASNAAITLKTDVSQTLVWVTSSQSGQPLPGVPVQLFDSTGKVLAAGTTDAHGLHMFPISYDNLQAAVVDDGHTVAMTLDDWRAPTPTAGGLQFMQSYVPPPNGTYAYTDRPIYRPGQQVHFRAVLWRDQDGLYSLYGSRNVQVQANDSTGHQLYSAQLPLDRFGSVHGTFHLPRTAPTGPAQLTFTLRGSQNVFSSATFNVAEYRKPELLTSVSTDRRSYVEGQTIHATVEVRYLFGAPVTGQPVSWTAYTQNRFQSPPGWASYSFGDQDAIDQELQTEMLGHGVSGGLLGTEVAHGNGTTDDQGRLQIALPVNLSGSPIDQTISVEATLTDLSHQSVSGRVEVPAHRAAFSLGLQPESGVVAAGSRETIDLAAVRDDGSAVPDQGLSAKIFERTYTSVMASNGTAGFWRQVPHDRLVRSQHLTTDRTGRARLSFTPRTGGIYYVAIEGRDTAGDLARSTLSIYSGAEGWSGLGQSGSPGLDLEPDKSTYRVGETAHVLVAAPWKGATALVSLERGTIRSVHVRRLTSSATMLRIPITPADLPNVYVAVTVYRGWRQGSPPDWRYGVTSLHVRLNPKRLRITLAQDKARYHPGDTVTYTIRTADVQGHPVSAEVSLALVDTAVLALQNETNADILQALYGERQLAVGTASDGVASIDHLQQTPAGGFPCGLGGGGGGGPAGLSPTASGIAQQPGARVRHHFADTAYWTATLVTDATGSATVHVHLPDNLTTWRLDARGVTADGRVGRRTLDSLSTQDVILRPATPRFLLQGDRLQLGTAVNNTLDRPLRISVSLTTAGLALGTATTQAVAVPPHGERLVRWQVDVPSTTSARLTFRALPSATGVQGDAIRLGLPIHPPLTGETVAAAGQVFGSTRQVIAVPGDAQSRPGALTVQVSPALVAGIGAAYRSLEPTPYDSNDDIAARVLAAAALRSLPASLSGLSPRVYGSLSAAIGAGVAGLARSQLADGGWPWYDDPGARSDPAISADVVEALSAAHTAGQSAASLRRGQRYLQTALSASPAGDRVHILSVLARSGAVDGPSLLAAFRDTVQLAQLDPGSLADLARGLELAGRRAEAGSLVARLDSQAMVSATGAHWEGGLEAGQSALLTSTRVLAGLVQLVRRDPLVPAAARWLILSRQGETWGCPCETAHALEALAAYAHAAHEGTARYRYSVTLDGRPALAGGYPARSGDAVAWVDVPVSALRRGAPSMLLIRRKATGGTMGTGPMYYLARLHYFLPAASIVPRDDGVAVVRRYLSLSGEPIDTVPAGTVVKAELTIRTGQTLQYLRVDDPLPSGLEAIDQSLQTSRQGLFPGGGPALSSAANELSPYLTHIDIRDDRVSLSLTSLPPGTYTYSYLVDATTPGRYGVAPTTAQETFFPEVFGRGAGQVFTVR